MIVTLTYTKFKLEQWFPNFSTCGLPTALHLTKKGYQWRSQFFGGAKYLTLGEKQYFCLGRPFSQHKMARYAKNSGWPCLPLDTPMTDTLWSLDQHYQQTGGKREIIYTLPYTILGPVKGWHTVLTNIECEAM